MEIIIVLVAVALIAVVWARDKAKNKDPVETWEPPKEMHLADKPWPYGEKLSEGKIHVKTADLAPTAPTGSENRVEATVPALTVDGHGDVQEVKPVKKAAAKKPAAKKTAAKPAVAKRAPAKKKSV